MRKAISGEWDLLTNTLILEGIQPRAAGLRELIYLIHIIYILLILNNLYRLHFVTTFEHPVRLDYRNR